MRTTHSIKIILCLALSIGLLSKCGKKNITADPPIQGTPGNPRFNLQFTNEQNVDLDLYVITPDGSKIYYSRKTGQGGSLDLDCRCGACGNGPNENIFWVPGTAPRGTYKYYVEFYETCTTGASGQSSDYTLRLLQNDKIIETKKGTLNSRNQSTTIWTYIY